MFADAESGEGIWVFSPRHYTRARRHTVAASRPPLSGYLERAPQFRHQQNALATEPLRLLQRQKLIKNIAFIWVSLSIETGCIENQAGIIVCFGIANNSGSRPLCCIIAAAQNSSCAHVLRHLSASTQPRFVVRTVYRIVACFCANSRKRFYHLSQIRTSCEARLSSLYIIVVVIEVPKLRKIRKSYFILRFLMIFRWRNLWFFGYNVVAVLSND